MLNSNEYEQLQKFEQLISDQFNTYSSYINDVIDKKYKFNVFTYEFMLDFYKNIRKLNIQDKYSEYATYILELLEQTPIHKQYIRYVKLKKINELNDSKN